jgi:hypothetical protein
VQPPLITESCTLLKWWRRRKSNPKATHFETSTSDTEIQQPRASQSVIDSGKMCAEQNPDTSVQLSSTSLHSKRVPEEYQLPEDLAKVVAAWPALPQVTHMPSDTSMNP